MGRPFGGINVEGTIAHWATHDVVFGHAHKDNVIKRSKLGDRNFIRVVNVGSSMPEGYVGDFARNTPAGLSYGVMGLLIYGGHIQSTRFVPMRELYALHDNA